MTFREAELLRTVLAKLDWLQEHCMALRPSDEEVRQISVVLRFLLVDKCLQNAWKVCGFSGQPTIQPTPGLASNVSSDPGLLFASSGGAKVEGGTIYGLRFYSRVPSSNAEVERMLIEGGEHVSKKVEPIPLNQFLNAEPCIVAGGKKMTRREVVKYVANKLGGAHLDETGRDQTVETMRTRLRLLNVDPVSYELLAIAQCLVSSPDVQMLARRMKETLA